MKNIITAGLLSGLLASAAHAQSGEAAVELAPVVVTGDLWRQTVQDIAASVTVLDQAEVDRAEKQHLEDVINLIPNFTWTGGTSRPRYFQIRGVGENSQFEGETPDSAVRFLLDDIDLTGLGTVAGLFDVRQVEILRGPQAGAYGANAAGGLVQLASHEPTPYWTGRLESSVGSDRMMAGGAAVGGPLHGHDPERLMFRLALYGSSQDGFRDNRTLGRDDTNERKEHMSRLKLRWNAADDVAVDAALFYAHADNGYDEFSLDNSRFDTFSDEPGRDEQETVAGSVRATHEGWPHAHLSAITRYADTDSLYSFDADWTSRSDPRSYNGFSSTTRDRQLVSQEIRLDSVPGESVMQGIDRWTLGVYAQRMQEKSEVRYTDDFGGIESQSEYEAETYAVFGQIGHDVTEELRLTIGLRSEYHSVDVDSSGASYGFPIGGRSKESDPLFGGKAGLEYDIHADQMMFASATRGYKAGGANVASFTLPDDPRTYNEETLWHYEAGLQSRWLDGDIQTRITGFYLHRDDVQLRDSVGAGGFFRYLTVNGEEAEHYGLETEASWFMTDTLTLHAGLGLLETDRKSYTDPGGVVPARALANAPGYTYNARLQYRAHHEGFFAQAELAGRDAYFESNNHNEKRSAFHVVNASAGYRINAWTITLWAKNILDERYEKRVFFFSNELDTATADPFDFAAPRRYENPADPRQIGLSIAYDW